jgi:5-methylcytosine-specific restriction protein A
MSLPVPCLEPGCSRTTRNGPRCPSHRTGGGWKGQRRNGYGSAWAKIRRAVLVEEPACRVCGAPSTDVDHIVPRSLGGTDDRSNLRGLCRRCHQTKTGKEGAHAAAAARKPLPPSQSLQTPARHRPVEREERGREIHRGNRSAK